MSSILLSKGGNNTIATQIHTVFKGIAPTALCVATAYLTLDGANYLIKLAKKYGIKKLNISAGISGEITHPNALRLLKNSGWDVRLGKTDEGIFHPKLLVVGKGYSDNGFSEALGAYFGSGNFTAAGLHRNVELGCVTQDNSLSIQATNAFISAWATSEVATDKLLETYENAFSTRLAKRTAEDLVFLEIAKDNAQPNATKRLKKQPVLDIDNCSTVWIGLESFTGEHRFQPELPKKAAEALNSMGAKDGDTITFEFSDGTSEKVLYKYYSSNSMFRLNLPNEMPGVKSAKINREGALVITIDRTKKTFRAEIVNGDPLQELRKKSYALDTWGKTTKRQYGWF